MHRRHFLNIVRRREFVCGAAVTTVALAAFVEAWGYGFGTLARIGPGFLPTVYSLVMGTMGIAILAGAFADEETVAAPRLRPIAAVVASLVAWIWLAPRAGFFVATLVLVIVSSTATNEARPLPTAIVAIASAVVGGLVFIDGFGVPLPMWPF